VIEIARLTGVKRRVIVGLIEECRPKIDTVRASPAKSRLTVKRKELMGSVSPAEAGGKHRSAEADPFVHRASM